MNSFHDIKNSIYDIFNVWSKTEVASLIYHTYTQTDNETKLKI